VTLLESAKLFFRRDRYLHETLDWFGKLRGTAGTCLAPYECTIPIEK
jgi:hypothetical protein